MFELNRKIILASQSPRRKQLLAEAGFDFEVKAMDVEETYPAEMPVHQVPEFLAIKKAEAAATSFSQEEEIIIASDCVVILDNVIYGKPTDYDDAVRILKALSGNIHEVVTGVCIKGKEQTVVFSGVSKVHFKPITEEEIAYYITKYQPYDKAGAYAIQEWIGLCKIEKIEGTYSNIMGLPMDLVYDKLKLFRIL
jgi:septum formation protein